MRYAAIFMASMAAMPAGAACVKAADLSAPAMFARYPLTPSKGPWRAPDVRPAEAHHYRTAIRAGSVGPPDFADHYTVVKIGCGAATICPAFVDRRSGRVIFVSAFRGITWVLSDFDDALPVGQLAYRRDSRLLAVAGWRNEDGRTGGVALYDWRGGRPRLVRFLPAKMFCREEPR